MPKEPASAELEYIIDLPFPVSVNQMYRVYKGRPCISGIYEFWKKRADALGFVQHIGALRTLKTFTAQIILARTHTKRPRDVDNYHKVVLDWAQSRGLIVNDSKCEEVIARWGGTAEAPEGCRLILRGLP